MSLIDAAKRAEYLLTVVRRFVRENPVSDYTVRYDDTRCDAMCLADDCQMAAEELRLQISKAVSA